MDPLNLIYRIKSLSQLVLTATPIPDFYPEIFLYDQNTI